MRTKNNNYNKIMASVVTASVVASALVTVAPTANAATTNFKDVQANADFFEAVKSLHARNIISGYEDGTFRPNEALTRAQAAKIITLALDLDTKDIKNPGFKDVNEKNWAYKYIAALANEGIIVGSNGEYKPNNPITRAQMAKIISLSYKFQAEKSTQQPFSDVKQNDWFNDYVGALVGNEITTGTTPSTFSPNKPVTRGQMAAFVYRSENKVNPVQGNETISNITNETLVTSEGTYLLSGEQKKWINPSNLAALKGAILKLTSTDNKIVQIKSVELTARGTGADTSNPYANHVVFDGKGATIDSDVTVNGDYITMKNITIKGDLHVSKGVANSFYSEFTKVEGKTTIDDSAVSAMVAPTSNFKVAANEDTNRGRVVFSEFQLGDVGVDKNAEVIFLSKTPGASKVGEIVVNSNATLTADSSVVLPKVIITNAANNVSLNTNIIDLLVRNTKKIELSGKSNITKLSLTNNAILNLQTIGRVNNLEAVLKETRVTIGLETIIGNLVIPTGSKPADIVENYNSTKGNVEKVNGTKNPIATPSFDTTPPAAVTGVVGVSSDTNLLLEGEIQNTISWATNTESDLSHYEVYRSTNSNGSTDAIKVSGNVARGTTTFTDTSVIAETTYYYTVIAVDTSGNRSTVSNIATVATALDTPVLIQVLNYATPGTDMIAVPYAPIGSTIKVYDAKTDGNVIGSLSVTIETIPNIVEILGGFSHQLDKVYISITEGGKAESDRVEKAIPTTFPVAPALNEITVIDNPSGEDKVTVKVPSDDYQILVYDVAGNRLKYGSYDYDKDNGLKTIKLTDGFNQGMSEIDVAILEVTDKGTQIAESLRTRVSLPTITPIIVNASDDPKSNDKIIITAGVPSEGNEFAYKIFDNENAAEAEKPTLNADVSSWTSLPSDGKITAANGKVIMVVERTTTGHAKKVGQVKAETVVNNQLLEAVTLDGKDGVSSQDGKVETIRMKFSSKFNPYLVLAKDMFSVEGFNVESIKVTDKNGRTPKFSNGHDNPFYTLGESQYITIRVEPREGTDFTPWVVQNPNEAITDINGVEIRGINIQAKDTAAPVIVSSVYIDNGSDGVNAGDQLTITFSEDVNPTTLAELADDFTLSNQVYVNATFANDDQIEHLGNTVTVTLGATTANKLLQGTTITMNEVGSAISLFDVAGNKAKPQKWFVDETVYSTPKTIDISNIPTPVDEDTNNDSVPTLPGDTIAPTAIVNPTAYNDSNGFSITMSEEATLTIGFHGSLKYRGATVSSTVNNLDATFNIGAPGAVNNNQIYFKMTDPNNNEGFYIAEMHDGKWKIFELPFFNPDQP